MPAPVDEIGPVLERVRQGQPAAREELIALLYGRLRQRAHQRLRHERAGHSLATTDLAHEAWLRLWQSGEFDKAADANQLFRAFARAMRQVLIDHARGRAAGKRGGGRRREELDDLVDQVGWLSQIEAISLHDALGALAGEYPRAAAVLELRYFGGYGVEEIAEILKAESVSQRTVERDSRLGLAWMRDHLSAGGTR